MTDLTKIEKPFGLLDAETQEALMQHGGPIEIFTCDGEWVFHPDPNWNVEYAYRVKPAPPKPREKWITVDCCVWDTEEEAVAAKHGVPVRYREVL